MGPVWVQELDQALVGRSQVSQRALPLAVAPAVQKVRQGQANLPAHPAFLNQELGVLEEVRL